MLRNISIRLQIHDVKAAVKIVIETILNVFNEELHMHARLTVSYVFQANYIHIQKF